MEERSKDKTTGPHKSAAQSNGAMADDSLDEELDLRALVDELGSDAFATGGPLADVAMGTSSGALHIEEEEDDGELSPTARNDLQSAMAALAEEGDPTFQRALLGRGASNAELDAAAGALPACLSFCLKVRHKVFTITAGSCGASPAHARAIGVARELTAMLHITLNTALSATPHPLPHFALRFSFLLALYCLGHPSRSASDVCLGSPTSPVATQKFGSLAQNSPIPSKSGHNSPQERKN
jgi:hypothetical protein